MHLYLAIGWDKEFSSKEHRSIWQLLEWVYRAIEFEHITV